MLKPKGALKIIRRTDETQAQLMQNAHNPTVAPQRNPAPIFPQLVEGQKLAGCYVLKGAKHIGNTCIWQAADEVLGKDISLHFIPQAVRADEKAMDELRHFTKRHRQLIHPNIVRIYDLIEESGWAAICTDVVHGDCLADLRRKREGGFFEVTDVQPWLVQLSRTLDDAHKIQLVHADLSAEHLYVETAGKLVVIGFGIGRCVRDALWRASGANGGTPPVENLSPQMLDGQTPGASDDVYATGVLLHELLTGHPPFTDPDISGKIRNAAAQTMTERREAFKRAGDPLPGEWENVVSACMEKTPERRPKNLAEVAARIAQPESRLPVTAVAQNELVSTPAKPVEKPEVLVAKKPWVAPSGAAPAPIVRDDRASSRFQPEFDDEENLEDASATAAQNEIPFEETEYGRGLHSKFPVAGVAAAAVFGGLCVYAAFFGGFHRKVPADSAPLVRAEVADESEYAPVKNSIAEPATSPVAASETKAPLLNPAPTLPTPAVASTPDVEAPVSVAAVGRKLEAEPNLLFAAATPKPAPAAKAPKTTNPAVATPLPAAVSEPSGSVSAKTSALESARKSVDEWEKAHAAMLKRKEQAEAAMAEAKKFLDEKMKAAAPMLKASEEVNALKQQREEELRAAEAAAVEARKAADEKARLADEAKKAVGNVEKENRDKLASQKKVETELDEIKKVIAENERVAAETAKLADGALAKKSEQAAVVKQKEQEVAMAMAAAEIEAQKKRDADDKRNRIMKEMDEARRLFEERMKALESSLKTPLDTPAPLPPPQKTPEVKPPTPPPAAAVTPTPAPEIAKPAVAATTAPVLPSADSTLLAKMEKNATISPEPKPQAPGSTPTTNSLGIPLVPVGDVQFAVWPTRIKDFETFASATGLKSNLWKDAGFKQGPDHPVVNVTWLEAMAFCKWLTFKEQREGLLPAGKIYRLPTDLEWSRAVGLPEESGKTAEARDMGVPDVYPWGTAWPPPQGAGNYTGEETGSDVAIKNYSDGFPWTAPVGSFPVNKYGLFDMGGNVWQWVMDAWNTDPTSKVLRGASWYNGALKLSLLSSCRVHAAQDSSTDNYGFRCVLANDSQKSLKR